MSNPNNVSLDYDKPNNDWLGSDIPEFNWRFKERKEESNQPSDNFLINVRNYVVEKSKSEEFFHLMNPVIHKLNSRVVESINESFLDWGKTASYTEVVEFLADSMGIEMPAIEKNIISIAERHRYPIAMFDDKGYKIRFFVDEQKQTTDEDDDDTFLKSIEIISHEMWHAYQHSEVVKGGNRAKIYEPGQKFTAEEIKKPENYLAYLKQPIETEAYVFGKIFSVRFAKNLENYLNKECENNKKIISEQNCKEIDPWLTSDIERTRRRLEITREFLNKNDEIKKVSDTWDYPIGVQNH